MARRKQYAPGGFAPQPMQIPEHPVLGPIFYLVVVCIAGVIMVTCFGPILDYFASYLAAMPNASAPYVNPTLELFQWSYWFIMALGAVAAIGVFLAVVRHIYYSRYGD